MNDKGAVADTGKFDNEVVFKGARFKCSIEMECDSADSGDESRFFQVLDLMNAHLFRIGAGKSKGLGQITVESIKFARFTPNEAHKFSASLNENLCESYTPKPISVENFAHYNLALVPESAFLFGAGYGDGDADLIAVRESVIESGKFVERHLIPASSIKGVLSHRTQFYINQHLGNFIDSADSSLDLQMQKIHALIFGSQDSKNAKAGRITISDMYVSDCDEKVFSHNAVDRFVGGVMNGALFQEKAVLSKQHFALDIYVREPQNSAESADFKIALDCFERAICDICGGNLGLGAMNSKGHGFFSGVAYKNGEKL